MSLFIQLYAILFYLAIGNASLMLLINLLAINNLLLINNLIEKQIDFLLLIMFTK